MDTYLMMLYVTLDQESALKKFFDDQGWSFCKPDLSVTTDKLGPTTTSKTSDSASASVVSGKRKITTTHRLAPKIKFVKIVSSNTEGVVKDSQHFVSHDIKSGNVNKKEEKLEATKPNAANDGMDTDKDLDNIKISDLIIEKKEKGKESDSCGKEDYCGAIIDDSTEVVDNVEDEVLGENEEEVDNDFDEVGDDRLDDDEVLDDDMNDVDDVGDDGNDDTDDEMMEGVNDEHDVGTEEKLDGTYNVCATNETLGQKETEASDMENLHSQTFDNDIEGDENKIIDTQEDVVNKLLSQSELEGHGYRCCICSKVIKVKYNMKRHLRTHLPGQINCNMCNQFFDSHEKKEKHMSKRHPSRHMCETCGISFKRKGDLNAHMIKHERVFDHENLPNCYKCKDCGKVFFRQTNYEYHLNVHSGVKPYECIKCLKPFHSKYSKNEHEKDCLNGEGHICGICTSQFKQKSGLHNHMQAEHVRSDKGFQCDICSRVFKFSSGLIRHKKDKHQLSDAYQQTEISEADVTSVKVKAESTVNTQTDLITSTHNMQAELITSTHNRQADLITSTNNTAYIVVTDIEPESKNSVDSVKVANDITIATSVVEEISDRNTAEIITAMSEQQIIESGTDINIERVIVVHQVPSDMPQNLDHVNN